MLANNMPLIFCIDFVLHAARGYVIRNDSIKLGFYGVWKNIPCSDSVEKENNYPDLML